MTDKHLSTQFDAELGDISTRVLEMGGLVESQVSQAVYALSQFSGETAAQVLRGRRARQRDGGRDRQRPVDASSRAASPRRATCAC